jgi:hypothetical protein
MSSAVFGRTVLINLHDAPIHHQVLQICIGSKCLHHLHPNAIAGPATLVHLDSMPMTVGFRETKPWRDRTSKPEHRFDKMTDITGPNEAAPS